jgi:hypothetical protein
VETRFIRHICSLVILLALLLPVHAQMITGVWNGKMGKQKTELKIIQNGDSLTGTSYYYESASNFRRYSIKGYFDAITNEAVWWDDQLLEEKPGRSVAAGKVPLLARADFNCPGGGRMMLDGKTSRAGNEKPTGDLHLDKTGASSFPDEWDFVLENYTSGANDPDIIDSIALIAYQPLIALVPREERPTVPAPRNMPIEKPEAISPPPQKIITPVIPPTIQEKFIARRKVLVSEIPLTGDSVELRFYDNAEIDGDSISLFLNDKLIFEHIRLLGSAYTIKLAVSDLNTTNELIMVAENLGSIPPNTSFMVAVVGDKRYEARLESTEGSSAMIRFVKKN